jgi:shikimate dehydrogenase
MQETTMKYAGLIGNPVAHSLSPRMQQAAFDAAGLEARYVLWETAPADLPARIASLRAPEILGANVTIPYKVDALALVDDYDPLAARVGAINTIVNREGYLLGSNTDVYGFMQALMNRPGRPFRSQGRIAAIMGTGGAARAAAVGLLGSGIAELMVLGRTERHLATFFQQLQNLAAALPCPAQLYAALLGSPEAGSFLSRADLVVNATPVGLHEEATPLIDVEALPTSTLVMDMIFNPPRTPLLRAAEAHGCPVLNGLTMLLYQGARAFELWTGLAAPIDVMRKALQS